MKYLLNYKMFEALSVSDIRFTKNIDDILTTINKDKVNKFLLKDILNNTELEKPTNYSTLSTIDKLNYFVTNQPQLLDDIYLPKLHSIADYLSANPRNLNVDSFNKLYDDSVYWHENLESKYLVKRSDETKDTDRFITFPNGWYWINLNVSQSEDEKLNMGHCGSDPGKILFSLRDENNQSWITASYNPTEQALYQIKGRNNSKPKKVYHPYIIAMILNSKYPVKYMFTGGYMPQSDFNILDLSESERTELLSKIPTLEYTDKMFESYLKTKDWTKLFSLVENGFIYNGYEKINKNDLKSFINILHKNKLNLSKYTILTGFLDYCRNGDTDIVKLLIDNGADVTADNNYAIKWASRNGHTDTVELLIDNGADVTADNNYKKPERNSLT